MNRNYKLIAQSRIANWAESRGTHQAVAAAIYAISDWKRSPEDIWEAPTPAEWDHVNCAVAEYVASGHFDYDESGYAWGVETIKIDDPR